jgi:hypothetical protein
VPADPGDDRSYDRCDNGCNDWSHDGRNDWGYHRGHYGCDYWRHDWRYHWSHHGCDYWRHDWRHDGFSGLFHDDEWWYVPSRLRYG